MVFAALRSAEHYKSLSGGAGEQGAEGLRVFAGWWKLHSTGSREGVVGENAV